MPTKLLTEAFEGTCSLSEMEQDRIAAMMIAEIDVAWDRLLESAESVALLAKMALAARREWDEGRTKPLNPNHI